MRNCFTEKREFNSAPSVASRGFRVNWSAFEEKGILVFSRIHLTILGVCSASKLDDPRWSPRASLDGRSDLHAALMGDRCRGIHWRKVCWYDVDYPYSWRPSEALGLSVSRIDRAVLFTKVFRSACFSPGTGQRLAGGSAVPKSITDFATQGGQSCRRRLHNPRLFLAQNGTEANTEIKMSREEECVENLHGSPRLAGVLLRS